MKGIYYLSKAAEKRLFPQLSNLNLEYNRIGSDFQNQNTSQNISNNINNNEQSPKYMFKGLLFNFANKNIKQLKLCHNKINDSDMLKLYQTQDKQKNQQIFHSLQLLNLSHNNIGPDGIKTFARELSERYPSLDILSLNNNQIKNQGIKYFIDSINQNLKLKLNPFPNLTELSLSNCHLSSQSMKILVSNQNTFNNLKYLELYDNPFIGDKGVNYFMKGCQHGAFPLLSLLNIANVNLTNNGIEYIIKQYQISKVLPSLSYLTIQLNQELVNLQLIKKQISKKFLPQTVSILEEIEQDLG